MLERAGRINVTWPSLHQAVLLVRPAWSQRLEAKGSGGNIPESRRMFHKDKGCVHLERRVISVFPSFSVSPCLALTWNVCELDQRM